MLSHRHSTPEDAAPTLLQARGRSVHPTVQVVATVSVCSPFGLIQPLDGGTPGDAHDDAADSPGYGLFVVHTAPVNVGCAGRGAGRAVDARARYISPHGTDSLPSPMWCWLGW